MSSGDDPLGEKIDRVQLAVVRGIGFVVSAGLTALAAWLLVDDNSKLHDGHIAAVLVLVAAAAVGLFAWGWPLIANPDHVVGWKRLWEGCMTVGTVLIGSAIASATGRDPIQMWLAWTLIACGVVLYLVAAFTWLRFRNS